jgi:hypothetical protein
VIERRRAIIPQVCGRALSKCRGQGFIDGRFEGDDFGDAKSLLHFLGIKSLKVADALLKLFDATPLLFDSEDRCFGLAGLGARGAADGTTGHAVSRELIKDIMTYSDSGDGNHKKKPTTFLSCGPPWTDDFHVFGAGLYFFQFGGGLQPPFHQFEQDQSRLSILGIVRQFDAAVHVVSTALCVHCHPLSKT